MNFFKQVLATIVGLTIFQLISFLMTFIFIGILIASLGGIEQQIVEVEDDSVLTLDLSYTINDKNGFSDFSVNDFKNLPTEKAGLYSLVKAIELAKDDDRIKGIYMPLSVMPNSYATIDLLRETIIDFRSSGKFVVAYGEMFDQKSYYLATAADKIYVNPEGYIELRGIGTRLTFYKKLLEEKLQAEVQVFKVGDFKSAVEPFILDKMSDANRKQLSYLLEGVKEDFVTNVSVARGVTPQEFDDILNNLKGLDPDSCVKYNLIDDTKYYDEILAELREKMDLNSDADINTVDLNTYAIANVSNQQSDNQVALVYAEGSIVDGKGDETSIGGESFSKQIRELRNDEDVDAIVIRINSPGGSALASEVMWREIELAKEVKPVVVSMGGVAASGGYYIACNSDRIFAEENTITGSIGVFGMVPNLSNFLNNKIGISFDDVLLNDHATSNGVTNKLSDFEAEVIQANVNKVYATFTNRVAEGRGLPIDSVLNVASGRVWTGEQALARGLVDEIGGVDEALNYAAKLADLDDFKIQEYPKIQSPFEGFLEDFSSGIQQKSIAKELGVLYPYYQELKQMEAMQGKVQARMPFDLEIK